MFEPPQEQPLASTAKEDQLVLPEGAQESSTVDATKVVKPAVGTGPS